MGPTISRVSRATGTALIALGLSFNAVAQPATGPTPTAEVALPPPLELTAGPTTGASRATIQVTPKGRLSITALAASQPVAATNDDSSFSWTRTRSPESQAPRVPGATRARIARLPDGRVELVKLNP